MINKLYNTYFDSDELVNNSDPHTDRESRDSADFMYIVDFITKQETSHVSYYNETRIHSRIH